MNRNVKVNAISGNAFKNKIAENPLKDELGSAIASVHYLMDSTVMNLPEVVAIKDLLKGSNVSSVSVDGSCDEFNNFWSYPNVLFKDGSLIHWSPIGGASSINKFSGSVSVKEFSDALANLREVVKDAVIFSMDAYVEISEHLVEVDLGITNSTKTRYSDDFMQFIASNVSPRK